MIDLPEQAIEELKVILKKDLGKEAFNQLNDNDVQQIGNLVLQLIATALKKHVGEGQ